MGCAVGRTKEITVNTSELLKRRFASLRSGTSETQRNSLFCKQLTDSGLQFRPEQSETTYKSGKLAVKRI
jgi:hypothetical protein